MDTFDDNGNPIDKKGNPTELKYRKQEPEKNHSQVDAPLAVVRPSQNPDLRLSRIRLFAKRIVHIYQLYTLTYIRGLTSG